MSVFKRNKDDKSNITDLCDWLAIFLRIVVAIAGCHQLATWICMFIESLGGTPGNHAAFRGLLVFMFIWMWLAKLSKHEWENMIIGWLWCWFLLIGGILCCLFDPIIFG